MRGQTMIRRAIRSGVTALAVAFFAVPQVSLAQAANDQVQVDPLMQKAARIKNMNSQMRITHAQRVEAAKEHEGERGAREGRQGRRPRQGHRGPGHRHPRRPGRKDSSSSKVMRARGAARSTSATALPVSELRRA